MKKESKVKVNEELKNEIFLDYLGGQSYTEISRKYSISKAYVNKLVTTGNWKERKTQIKQATRDNIDMVVVDAAVETVNRFMRNNLKALKEVEDLLYNDDALKGKDGNKSIYKVREIIESMHLIENQVKQYMNIINPIDAHKLRLQYEQLKLKETLINGSDNEDVQDNFIDILTQSLAKAQEMNNGNIVEE